MKSGILAALLLFTLVGCSSKKDFAPKNISNKDRIQALLSIAAANVTENDSAAAIESLNKARDLDDSVAEIYYLYSLAYLHINETRLATESARFAVRLDPKYSAAKNALGKILLDQGKYDEAEKHLLEAASDLLYRESYLAKINLGVLHYKKMNYPKSEMWFTKAIGEGNKALTCIAYYYRGKIEMTQNDLKLAQRDLNQSVKGSCSGMSDVHIAIGQAFVREKKFDQARAKFVEIQRIFPSTEAYDQAAQYLREIP